MRSTNGQFAKGNNGKPKGTKHRFNRETLYTLLERITSDLSNDYTDLSNSDKIRLITAFKQLYLPEQPEHNELQSIPFNELLNALRK